LPLSHFYLQGLYLSNSPRTWNPMIQWRVTKIELPKIEAG
jgi:hypothetical protein